MKQNLFDLTKEEYKFERKAAKLRQKIANITLGLDIKTDHDENGHFYLFNGKRLPSVTGKLQILKDPSLANWKMNMAIRHVKTYWFPDTPFSLEQIEGILTGASLAGQLEFEGAGDIGKQVHNWREEWFRKIIETGNRTEFHQSSIVPTKSEVISGCRAIGKFMSDTKYLPLACELYLADETLGVGGTGDDVGMLDGKVAFIDLKTSNIGDKDAYFYQVALYVYMFEKLYGIRTQVHKIIHVSKTDGTYKLIDIPDIRKRIREAKHLIKVDNFLAELRESKKKQPIII